jgi:tetratricopeptide (TPR) repeat protein
MQIYRAKASRQQGLYVQANELYTKGLEITTLTLKQCESENAALKLKISTENINKKLLSGFLDLNIDIGNYKNVIKILNDIKINLDNKSSEISNISDIEYQYYLAILYKFQGLYKLSHGTFNNVLSYYRDTYINHPNICLILGFIAEIQSSNCEHNDSLTTISEVFLDLLYPFSHTLTGMSLCVLRRHIESRFL